jgi:capsular polysaccharide biosynthesis protein
VELWEIFSAVRKRWLVVALVLVFCVGGASLYAFSQPRKSYASSSTIAFLPDEKNHQAAPPESLSSLLTTYAVVAESERTITAAEGILGRPLPGSVTAAVGSGSLILAITSEAPTAAGAAETANAATQALTESIRGNGFFAPNVVNHPVASSIPVESRSPKLVIAVAAVIGLIAGVLLALLIENLAGLPGGTTPAPPVAPEPGASIARPE